jgi:molecular chaperone GrpE
MQAGGGYFLCAILASGESFMVDEVKTTAGNDVEQGNDKREAQQQEEAPRPSAEEMTQLLEDARAKADEHWNQYLRAAAELENLRRRSERDLENAHKYALEKFAAELLPVKDSLEMGLAAAEGDSVDPVKLREGVELTLKMLSSVMERFSIREVDPMGEKFDPQLHEAMSVQPRSDVEPDRVVAVVQKGYLLNDRLIRPAMVMVSREPDGPKVDERA